MIRRLGAEGGGDDGVVKPRDDSCPTSPIPQTTRPMRAACPPDPHPPDPRGGHGSPPKHHRDTPGQHRDSTGTAPGQHRGPSGPPPGPNGVPKVEDKDRMGMPPGPLPGPTLAPPRPITRPKQEDTDPLHKVPPPQDTTRATSHTHHAQHEHGTLLPGWGDPLRTDCTQPPMRSPRTHASLHILAGVRGRPESW